MKKLFTLIFILVICIPLDAAAQKNKLTPVLLNVTIDDSISQTAGIGSDGAGTYVNGQNSVSAQFTGNGYFAFRSGMRIVNAVYSISLGDSQTTQTLPAFDSAANVEILTFVSSSSLQNMPVGSSRCEGLAVNITFGDVKRTIGYRAGRGTLTNTGFVLVSHPDANTWIMESDTLNACNSSDFENVARIRDAKTKGKPSTDVDYGRYMMPLKLVLTRQ